MKLPPNKQLRWLPYPPYSPVIEDRHPDEPEDYEWPAPMWGKEKP